MPVKTDITSFSNLLKIFLERIEKYEKVCLTFPMIFAKMEKTCFFYNKGTACSVNTIKNWAENKMMRETGK
jgi:hypothetical protein